MRFLPINLLVVLTAFVSCNDRTIDIAIRNQTRHNITSLNVYVQGKEYSVENIEPDKKSKLKIRRSDISLNNHDFRIETKHKNQDSTMVTGFYYTDLSGSPNSHYQIEVFDLKTVIK